MRGSPPPRLVARLSASWLLKQSNAFTERLLIIQTPYQYGSFVGRKSSTVADVGPSLDANSGDGHTKRAPPIRTVPLPPSQAVVAPIQRNVDEQTCAEPLRTATAAIRETGRLIGSSTRRDDPTLWVQLLELEQRLYGNKGVRKVWKEVKLRDIVLPTSGKHAERLWDSFISLAFETPQGLHDLYGFALKSRDSAGGTYEFLYEHIVGQLLRNNPQLALRWHKRLLEAQFNYPSNTFQKLSKTAAASPRPDALGVFKRIYLDGEERNIHDDLVRALCDSGRHDVAYRWHLFLVNVDDLLRSPSASKALLDYLAVVRETPSRNVVENAVNGLDTTSNLTVPTTTESPEGASVVQNKPSNSRDLIYRFIGYRHNFSPKLPSDNLCARLFATRGFSVETVIHGLGILGVESIGPLAMRELALRALEEDGPAHILHEIELLGKAGISIGESVFSRVVEKFAKDDKRELLEDILSSDLHPDEYDDRQLLNRLLESSMNAPDPRRTHSILSVLSAFNPNPPAEAWNLLLRRYVEQGKLPKVLEALEDMRINDTIVSAGSLTRLITVVLPPRRPGHRPSTDIDGQDRIGLVANILLSILTSGRPVPTECWPEIIRRFGMGGRWKQLEHLLLSLGQFYSAQHFLPQPRPSQDADVRPPIVGVPKHLPAAHPQHPLRQLFPPSLQRAIIAWSFQAAFHPTRRQQTGSTHSHPGSADEKSEQWARGLLLLQQLKGHGVLVQTGTVREALRQRLWTYFGPFPSQHHTNQVAPDIKLPSLRHMVQHADNLWGNTLLRLDERLLATGTDEEIMQNVMGTLKVRKTGEADLKKTRGPKRRFVLKPGRYPHIDRLVKPGKPFSGLAVELDDLGD